MEFGWALVIAGIAFGIGALYDAVSGTAGGGVALFSMGAAIGATGIVSVILASGFGRMGSMPTLPITPVPSVAGSTQKVERMIRLAETQLLALTLERSDLNARAMGLLAFDGALGAVFVAAEDQLNVHHIQIALVGLVISVVLAIRATKGKPEVGPNPVELLSENQGETDHVFDVAFLTRLNVDVINGENAATLSHASLEWAIGITLVTLFVAGLLAVV